MISDIKLSDGPPAGRVYALVASDEPLQVRYVGKVQMGPWDRLRHHLKDPQTRKLAAWFDEVHTRGAEIRMRILGEYPRELLEQAECSWFKFWRHYCDLLNSCVPMVTRPRPSLPRTLPVKAKIGRAPSGLGNLSHYWDRGP